MVDEIIKRQAFSNVLRERRRAVGLSQDEFAKRIGISRISIGKWEQGRVKGPTPQHRDSMISALNMTEKAFEETMAKEIYNILVDNMVRKVNSEGRAEEVMRLMDKTPTNIIKDMIIAGEDITAENIKRRLMPRETKKLVLSITNLYTNEAKGFVVKDVLDAMKKAFDVLPNDTRRNIDDLGKLFLYKDEGAGYVGKYFYDGDVYELTLIEVV